MRISFRWVFTFVVMAAVFAFGFHNGRRTSADAVMMPSLPQNGEAWQVYLVRPGDKTVLPPIVPPPAPPPAPSPIVARGD